MLGQENSLQIWIAKTYVLGVHKCWRTVDWIAVACFLQGWNTFMLMGMGIVALCRDSGLGIVALCRDSGVGIVAFCRDSSDKSKNNNVEELHDDFRLSD